MQIVLIKHVLLVSGEAVKLVHRETKHETFLEK